jgi:hypothetical protein
VTLALVLPEGTVSWKLPSMGSVVSEAAPILTVAAGEGAEPVSIQTTRPKTM